MRIEFSLIALVFLVAVAYCKVYKVHPIEVYSTHRQGIELSNLSYEGKEILYTFKNQKSEKIGVLYPLQNPKQKDMFKPLDLGSEVQISRDGKKVLEKSIAKHWGEDQSYIFRIFSSENNVNKKPCSYLPMSFCFGLSKELELNDFIFSDDLSTLAVNLSPLLQPKGFCIKRREVKNRTVSIHQEGKLIDLSSSGESFIFSHNQAAFLGTFHSGSRDFNSKRPRQLRGPKELNSIDLNKVAAQSISGNGKLISGYVIQNQNLPSKGSKALPCLWRNEGKECQLLKNLPTSLDSLTVEFMPSLFTCCSEDGEHIFIRKGEGLWLWSNGDYWENLHFSSLSSSSQLYISMAEDASQILFVQSPQEKSQFQSVYYWEKTPEKNGKPVELKAYLFQQKTTEGNFVLTELKKYGYEDQDKIQDAGLSGNGCLIVFTIKSHCTGEEALFALEEQEERKEEFEMCGAMTVDRKERSKL